jgi:hypothetical protein
MSPTPRLLRDEMLREVLGYDDARITELEQAGTFGSKK